MTEYDIETVVTTRPLPAGKYGRLIPANREKDYLEVVAVATGGGHKVEICWPWHQSVPLGDAAVLAANRKALDMARKSLVDYLRTHKPKTFGQKIMDFFHREFEYMKKMSAVSEK